MKAGLRKVKYGEYIRDFTALGNPFLLLLITSFSLFHFDNFLNIFLKLIVGFFINEIICSGIKYIWHKPRPNGQKFQDGFEKIDAGSFPSIHASRISFVYLNIGYMYYKTQMLYISIICLVVILVVGYSRIFLKKHFLTDVLAGYLIGTIFFILFQYL